MQNVLISKPETIQEILVNATRVLGATMSYREARLQAEILLAHALGISRAGVLARLNEKVAPDIAAQYAANVARRAQHEPLAYILGHQEFYGLDFLVDRRVLIPRHETELLVLLALERIRYVPHVSPIIVDVGTGSGAIALALAHHLSQVQIFATEISPDARAVAEMNALHLNMQARVKILPGDLLTRVEEPIDILVANLPYIPSARYKTLPREIRDYEPRIALDGGDDGLAVMRRMLAQMQARAKRGAVAFLEISEEQGEGAVELVKHQSPRAPARLYQDLEGLDRVIEIQFQDGR